jgi:hypothetical protein
MHILAATALHRIKVERAGGVLIGSSGKRMVIAFKARLGRPVREGDAILKRSVALRHPLRFFNTDRIEEVL